MRAHQKHLFPAQHHSIGPRPKMILAVAAVSVIAAVSIGTYVAAHPAKSLKHASTNHSNNSRGPGSHGSAQSPNNAKGSPLSKNGTPGSPKGRSEVKITQPTAAVKKGSSFTLSASTLPDLQCSASSPAFPRPKQPTKPEMHTTDAQGNVSWTVQLDSNIPHNQVPLIVRCQGKNGIALGRTMLIIQ